MAAADETVTPPAERRSRRILRGVVKWCRLSFLLLLLVVVVLGLFLNHVGLPDWLEKRISDQFRERGWELQFSRLRLRWYRGVVAEDLQLHRTNSLQGPNLFARSTEFPLSWATVRNLRLEPQAALLKGARLLWPLPGTNRAQRTLVLENVAGELRFKKDDHWELKFLEARLLGVQVRFRGDITNASLIRDWKFPRTTRPGGEPPALWQRLLTEAEQIHFLGQPELNTTFFGDARDWRSFAANLRFTGPGLAAPWGQGTNISLVARWSPRQQLSQESGPIDLTLEVAAAQTRWGRATNVSVTLAAEPSLTNLWPAHAHARVQLQALNAQGIEADRAVMEFRSQPAGASLTGHRTQLDLSLEAGRASNAAAAHLTLQLTAGHSSSAPLPAAIESTWTLRDVQSRWITCRWAQATAQVQLPGPDDFAGSRTNEVWPERLKPFPMTVTATLSNILVGSQQARDFSLKGAWNYPHLALATDAKLNQGNLGLIASLDTATGELQFQARTQAALEELHPFLSPGVRAELSRWTFESWPRVQANGRILLPPWNELGQTPAKSLLPRLVLAGRLETERGVGRGVSFSAAQLPFALTNLVWSTSGFNLVRPEGSLRLAGSLTPGEGDFRCSFESGINPLAFAPAFPQPVAQEVFGFFELSQPPRLAGELRGNWNDLGRLHGFADVAATNLVFRGQPIKAAAARVVYTNKFLSILAPVIVREGEEGRAAGIGLDLSRPRLFLTNATGKLAPRAITRSINAEVDATIAPFIFDTAPVGQAEGSVPLGRSDRTENMRFEVQGGPFHWQRFHLEQIKATIIWLGDTVTITNLIGRWRGADVQGWAHFDFARQEGGRFQFYVGVKGGDLRAALKDLEAGKSRKVEGIVNGELHVTSADTHDWNSWQGYGHAHLVNGLLWDIPLFGVFSPLLNTITPSLGNSRARHAVATYQITNSVIVTRDLEIRATAMRMNYQGSIDFEQQVEGRMEAELLRDFPVFGLLIAKVFWPVTKLFEYKITGTLDKPKTEELFTVSKILMAPLHPIKSLKDFMQLEETPPAKPPEKPAPKTP